MMEYETGNRDAGGGRRAGSPFSRIINARHPGQKSRLRRRFYEAVGMLLNDRSGANRLIVAVPLHRETEKISCRMAARCCDLEIEIALVSGIGDIQLCTEDKGVVRLEELTIPNRVSSPSSRGQ